MANFVDVGLKHFTFLQDEINTVSCAAGLVPSFCGNSSTCLGAFRNRLERGLCSKRKIHRFFQGDDVNPTFSVVDARGNDVCTGLGCAGSLVQPFHFDSLGCLRVRCCFISISIYDNFFVVDYCNVDPCLWLGVSEPFSVPSQLFMESEIHDRVES